LYLFNYLSYLNVFLSKKYLNNQQIPRQNNKFKGIPSNNNQLKIKIFDENQNSTNINGSINNAQISSNNQYRFSIINDQDNQTISQSGSIM
jgi:hypothetical protein